MAGGSHRYSCDMHRVLAIASSLTVTSGFLDEVGDAVGAFMT